jgi:formate dehydrogenase major subunit
LLGRLRGDRGSRERVWIGQEPSFDGDQPVAALCRGRRGARLVHGDRRLKYPMKLVNGQWTAPDKAINEIGDKLWRSARSRADSVYWLGSAKFSNEGAFLGIRGVLGHQQR